MARYDENEVTVIETEGGSSARWFLFGALLGAGVALLLAPQSGERTRRDLAKRAKQLRREAEERWDDVVDGVEEKGREIKERVEDWADDVVDEVKEGKRAIERKTADARDELDRRLSAARARRRPAIAADGVADDEEEHG